MRTHLRRPHDMNAVDAFARYVVRQEPALKARAEEAPERPGRRIGPVWREGEGDHAAKRSADRVLPCRFRPKRSVSQRRSQKNQSAGIRDGQRDAVLGRDSGTRACVEGALSFNDVCGRVRSRAC